MLYYLFLALKDYDCSCINSIEEMDRAADDYFSVTLSREEELNVLLKLLGIDVVEEELLPNSKDFVSIIDISQFQLPEYSQEEFDNFYGSWISITGRESNMDEYGQLIFISGYAKTWNKMPDKLVLREKS